MVPPAKRLRRSEDKGSRHSPEARRVPAQGTVDVCQLKPVVDELVQKAMRKSTAETAERLKEKDARITEQDARIKELAERLELHEKIVDLRIDGQRERLEEQTARLEEQDELVGNNAADVRRLTKKVDDFEDWIWERFMKFQDATDDAIFGVLQFFMTMSMNVSMSMLQS